MKIAVIGAGIGGLSAAAFLHRGGHDVTIFEAASRLGEVGAGIQISPNGSRLLIELGIDAQLQRLFVTPSRLVLRRWEDDSELTSTELGELAHQRWGAPYYNAYRPDVISVLRNAAPDIPLEHGARLSDLHESENSVELTFADDTTFSADMVVGADGIHSSVRQRLFGEYPTRFSGMVAYRALVKRELVDYLPIEATNRVGPGGHVVTYFVGQDARYLNVVAIMNQDSWTTESWTEEGDVEEMRARFASWSPTINDILAKVETPVFRWALHDREPLTRWSTSRCTLIGDACHPMVPLMAQGACQAIEDGAVLAQAIAQHDIPNALRIYQDVRLPRTSTFQERSFANATSYHLPDGAEQVARDELFALGAGRPDPLSMFDWIYGYHASLEN